MKDTSKLTRLQAEHIAELQDKVDLMEHGVVHAAYPLLAEITDAAERRSLTIERFRAAVEQFKALLACLDDQQNDLNNMFDHYVKKNSESEGTAHA